MGISFFTCPVREVSLCGGCSFSARLLYPFFHAGVLHALLNAWSLLCVVFLTRISLSRLFAAYLVAVSFPFACAPTVGLSGVVFALLGRVAFEGARPRVFILYSLAVVLLGFLFPKVNAVLHLYCYVAGLLVGFLDSPVRR